MRAPTAGRTCAVSAVDRTDFDSTTGHLLVVVDTDCGPASLELLWLSARAVRVVFHPPLGVDEFGDAWALAPHPPGVRWSATARSYAEWASISLTGTATASMTRAAGSA